jgi:hypothetical protein
MKKERLGLNKISKYYRVSGYVSSLERVTKSKNSSIYPYLPNQLAINAAEGLKLSSIGSNKPMQTNTVQPISPINEQDDYYA